jgi:malonyl-CoA O-methyltransferase
MELTYKDVDSVIRDLRSCGAVNLAAGRRRSLTGRIRWGRFVAALEGQRRDGRIPMTFELILGHAWALDRSRRAPSSRSGEAAIAVSDIGFRRRPAR